MLDLIMIKWPQSAFFFRKFWDEGASCKSNAWLEGLFVFLIICVEEEDRPLSVMELPVVVFKLEVWGGVAFEREGVKDEEKDAKRRPSSASADALVDDFFLKKPETFPKNETELFILPSLGCKDNDDWSEKPSLKEGEAFMPKSHLVP